MKILGFKSSGIPIPVSLLLIPVSLFIKRGDNKTRSPGIVLTFSKIEDLLLMLLKQFDEREKTFHSKELNELAEQQGYSDVSPNKLRTIIISPDQ